MNFGFFFEEQQNDVETLAFEQQIEILQSSKSVALFKPDPQTPGNTILSPTAVSKLIEQNVRVYVQRGFSNNDPYSDEDYAAVGAQIIDNEPDLLVSSKLLVKFDAFSDTQIETVKENATLLSVSFPNEITPEYMDTLNGKKITGVALETVNDVNGKSFIEIIRALSQTDEHCQIGISNFVLPIVETLLFAPSITNALRYEPKLIQAIYCYKGYICSAEIARKVNQPSKDILSLSWDLN